METTLWGRKGVGWEQRGGDTDVPGKSPTAEPQVGNALPRVRCAGIERGHQKATWSSGGAEGGRIPHASPGPCWKWVLF